MTGIDEARLSPLAAIAARGDWLKWAILMTASLGAILEVIDVSIVNVALTDMQANLGATLGEIGWVITGYSVANVVIIPLTAWLGNRFGRKTYFLFSLAVFILASMMCGLAPNLPILVIARVAQGLGGGVLLANAQSVIFETFPPAQRAVAQAVFGLGIIAGPALGPTLGGYLSDTLGWRWIFFINLPVGIIAVLLGITFLPADVARSTKAPQVDWSGIGLLVLGLGAFQILLEEGQKDDWFASRFICGLAAVGATALLVFVWQELRVTHPAVDLRVLRHRSVAAGSLYSLVLGAGLYGVIFAVPVFAQNYLHFTAMQTGNLLGPGAIASAVIMVFLGKLAGRVDARFLVACGGLITAAVAFQLAQITPLTGAGDLFRPLVLRGAGSVLMFLPLSLATLGPVPKADIAAASGFYNLTRQLGGSLGIAVMTALVARREALHLTVLEEKVSLFSQPAHERLALFQGLFEMHGADPLTAHRQPLTAMDALLRAQAGVLAFADIFRYVGFAFIATLPLLLLLDRGGKKPAPAAADH